MKIYRLSTLGYSLSHSTRFPNTPEWRVIHYLGRMHSASRDKIISEVDGATIMTLERLRMKGVLIEDTGVSV